MIEFEGNKREYSDKIYQELYLKSLTDKVSPEFLEEKLAGLTNRKYAVCIDNATNGLFFALKAYGISNNDEVLVTDFSWVSTASCIVRVGATPVFCDIDRETYCISFESVKKMKTEKTKALIYTPLFGALYDTSEIIQFCKENNIIFIEDAAQTMGASYNGRPGGADGDCSVISFNSNKVISSPVGGGVFLTDDKDKADYVRKLRRHGDFETLGYNAIMHPLAILTIDYKLNKMDEWQKRRQYIAKEYMDILDEMDFKYQKHSCNHNYHKFVVEFNDEDEYNYSRGLFLKNGIIVNKHYKVPLHDIFEGKLDKSTEDISNKIMSLPIYAQLTDEEVEKIINVIGNLW